MLFLNSLFHAISSLNYCRSCASEGKEETVNVFSPAAANHTAQILDYWMRSSRVVDDI
jgi:hypothetical protein